MKPIPAFGTGKDAYDIEDEESFSTDPEPEVDELDDEEGEGPWVPPEAGGPDDWEDGVEAGDFIGEFWNDPDTEAELGLDPNDDDEED